MNIKISYFFGNEANPNYIQHNTIEADSGIIDETGLLDFPDNKRLTEVLSKQSRYVKEWLNDEGQAVVRVIFKRQKRCPNRLFNL